MYWQCSCSVLLKLPRCRLRQMTRYSTTSCRQHLRTLLAVLTTHGQISADRVFTLFCLCSHIIQRLLAAGHTVHGTARHPGSATGVAHLMAMDGAAQRLRLFKADLMTPGDFHEAVAGCDVVIHTASPYQLDVPAGESGSQVQHHFTRASALLS